MLFSNILSRVLQVPLLSRHGTDIPKHDNINVPIDSTGLASPLNTEFDLLVKSSLEFYKIPGLAVAVLQGNQTFARVWMIYHCELRKKLM